MMEEKRTRRQFAQEFKAEFVELPLNGDKTAVDVARNLGTRVELLYRRKNEYLGNRADARLADPAGQAFPGLGLVD